MVKRIDNGFYESTEVNDGTFLRGIVVDVNDPFLEGRVAVTIPRLMPDKDPSGITLQEETKPVGNDFLENKELAGAIKSEVKVSNALWARPVRLSRDNFQVPYVGSTIYVFMEDGDPSKLYYLPFNPTILGDNPDFFHFSNPKDVFTPDLKPNVHLFAEFKDKCIVYYNENPETKEFNITLPKKSHIMVNENEKDTSIKVSTPSGFKIHLDETAKHILVSTPSGHNMILDDNGDKIQITTKGGSTINMSGDGNTITTSTSGGATIKMSGGKINLN